jgi:hypothetical protein
MVSRRVSGRDTLLRTLPFVSLCVLSVRDLIADTSLRFPMRFVRKRHVADCSFASRVGFYLRDLSTPKKQMQARICLG